MRRLIAIAFAGLLLAACASRGLAAKPLVELPRLHLAPAALGREISEQQQLTFRHGTKERELDALLEVDAGEVRLLVQAMGQSGVRLSWDGKKLVEQRAPWLPPAVRGGRVLDDLQFALWPLDSIRKALPAGWHVEEIDGERRLSDAESNVWLTSKLESSLGWIVLDNRAEDYELIVHFPRTDLPPMPEASP